jgi:hypothetical protein
MKLIIENWRSFINEEVVPELPQTITTFGDLKKIIKQVNDYYKAVELGKMTQDAAVTAVNGIINAITFGASGSTQAIVSKVMKAKDLGALALATELPEEETIASPLLSMFNIDDDYSKILDDKIEKSFINYLQKLIVKIPDSTPIVQFDINAQLESFIKQKFNISCKDVDGIDNKRAKEIDLDVVKNQGIKTAKSAVKDTIKTGIKSSLGLKQ